MRFGLLTQWYDPEPGPAALPAVLARGLHARGHEIQVLTGFPNYPTGQVAPGYQIRRRTNERLAGVDIRRVAVYPSHDRSALRRIANYGSFALSATASGLDALRGLDALWVGCSPITVGLPMLAARARFKVPCVTHVLDLWPDTILATGFGTDTSRYRFLVAKPLGAFCHALYRRSAAVVYISPGVGEVLRERGVPARKLRYVPLWADEDVFKPTNDNLRSELGLTNDQVVVLYAGALGEAQGLTTLIDASAQVADSQLMTIIAGSGTAEKALADHLRTSGAVNVRMIGRVSQQAMTKLMATADVSYIGLRDHPLSSITMPSKIQSVLASAKPLLVAATGDVAQVARESGAGWVVDPTDTVAIASTLREACELDRGRLAELGLRARTYYQQNFSVQHGVDQIERLLIEAARKVRA